MRRLVLATVVLTTTAGFSPVRPRRSSLATRANLFRGGEGEAKLHIAGQLFPALRSTVISSERLGVALEKVMVAAFFADLAVMGVLYAGAEPVLRAARLLGYRFAFRVMASIGFAPRDWKSDLPPWEQSYAKIFAKGSRRLAKTMLTLWTLDLTCLAVHTIGLPIRGDLPLAAAAILYPIWFGRLASQLKRRYLGVQRVNGETVAPGRQGKVLVYDRLGDFLIGVAALVVSLEILSLETGVAFTSLIAVSGASSVVVALACQEPLGHVINGLLLTFNDKFRPGEEIMFGDVAGIVTQMGWFDTKIRLYSERTVCRRRRRCLLGPYAIDDASHATRRSSCPTARSWACRW